MGELRESHDSEMKLPSSWFGFGDWPKDADILLDDICETILTKNIEQGFGDLITYDEFDKLRENGLRGAGAGRVLREQESHGLI